MTDRRPAITSLMDRDAGHAAAAAMIRSQSGMESCSPMNGSGRLARCAIYTRKSTEYNLELAFNSLDAQREACEAYVKSQAHEGWRSYAGDWVTRSIRRRGEPAL